MKLTAVLYRQPIGFHFKKHWHVQGKRKVIDTGAVKTLKAKGIRLYEPQDILQVNKAPSLINEVPDYIPLPIKLDHNHPLWHNRICYTYKDHNVLLEGLNQAKVITKTVELQQGLPEQLHIKNSTAEFDDKVKNIILSSHIFDAQQEKLPIRKDPERPAWNFPRDYGITDKRINTLIITKLLQLIELISDPKIVKQRTILNDLQFRYPFEKAGDLIQFQLRGDMLVTSSKPLPAITSTLAENLALPDVFPIKHTITLNEENIYEIRNIYPVNKITPKFHPHTVFVHYNSTEVKNLYEEEVTESQFLGRSLMKAFAVAATYAKQTFGDDVTLLPKPVIVQCVHTDGCIFHFSVFQLNTLDLEEGDIKNIWYQSSRIPLFTSCGYKQGKPCLEGYNNDVIKYLLVFYNNY